MSHYKLLAVVTSAKEAKLSVNRITRKCFKLFSWNFAGLWNNVMGTTIRLT